MMKLIFSHFIFGFCSMLGFVQREKEGFRERGEGEESRENNTCDAASGITNQDNSSVGVAFPIYKYLLNT